MFFIPSVAIFIKPGIDIVCNVSHIIITNKTIQFKDPKKKLQMWALVRALITPNSTIIQIYQHPELKKKIYEIPNSQNSEFNQISRLCNKLKKKKLIIRKQKFDFSFCWESNIFLTYWSIHGPMLFWYFPIFVCFHSGSSDSKSLNPFFFFSLSLLFLFLFFL